MTRLRHEILRSALAQLGVASLLSTAAMAQDPPLPPHRAYSLDDDTISVIDEEKFEVRSTIAMPEGTLVFSWNNAEKDRLALIIQAGALIRD